MPAAPNPLDPPRNYRSVCAFCGACEHMSQEHVFPQWLADELPQTEGTFTHSRDPDTGPPTNWTNVKIDVKVPIGEGCNTGWMSDLEGDAKPILRELLTARRQRTTLSMDDQDTLALWIAKTVYMHELSLAERTIPAGAYRELHAARTPPANARIWLSAYGGARDPRPPHRPLASAGRPQQRCA
jgi:hypothetical protein